MKNGYNFAVKDRIMSVIAGTLFIITITAAVFWFSSSNYEYIAKQSENYIKDISYQKITFLYEKINDDIGRVKTISYLYGLTLKPNSSLNTEFLKELEKNTEFEYVGFIDERGTIHTADGREADCSDRPYFKSGMQGKSGAAIVKSRICRTNMLGAYAPVFKNEKIVGLIVCFHSSEKLAEFLRCKSLGGDPKIMLAAGEAVISNSSVNDDISLDELLGSYDFVNEFNKNKIYSAIKKSEEVFFRFNDNEGISCGFAVPLRVNNWYFIVTFPLGRADFLSDSLKQNAWTLVLILNCAFIFYTAVLILYEIHVRRTIAVQNRKYQIISSGTQKILKSFVFADLKNDTYEFLTGSDGVHVSGAYADYIDLKVSGETEASEKEELRANLSKEYITDKLSGKNNVLTFLSHAGAKWYTVSIVCLERKDGVPVKILLTKQDITELKDEQLRQAALIKGALEQAKIASEAKSTFLSKMSHDIRTPINGIIGMTSIAAVHLDDAGRVGECLRKITSASRHLLNLINEVLDMSKIESGKMNLIEEDINLSDLIDNLLNMIKPQIAYHNHELKVSISDIRHENVIGDSLHIQKCFTNLMQNAIKYTPDGGTIKLSITEKYFKHNMACYEFIFEDNGYGMSEEFQKVIFEPFSRAEDTRINKIAGSGLGMAITKNIVSMMGGTISVESRPNQGSKFTVTILLKANDSKEADCNFSNLKVLIADDDKDSNKSVKEILDSMGMECRCVSCGQDALAEAEKGGYSAVFIDLTLPEWGGIKTAEAIKKACGDKTAMAMISVEDMSYIESEAKAFGVSYFVEKPLFKSKFINVFKSLSDSESSTGFESSITSFESIDLKGRRILLVEDNELNAEIASEILEMTGAEIEIAEDGQEALDRVGRAEEGTYDLIFMDIQMPKLNGLEAASRIRALNLGWTDKIPIVAMSANAFAEDIQASKDAGMNGHISKPLDLKILAEVLNTWLV